MSAQRPHAAGDSAPQPHAPKPPAAVRRRLLALAFAPAAALASAVACARDARAQEVSVEVRAGGAPIAGRYAAAFDGGPLFGIGVRTRVARALALRADASVQALDILADGEAWTFTLGVERPLLPAGERPRAPVRLTAALGGGAALLRYTAFEARHAWHPAATGGVRLTAALTRRLGAFADATANATVLGGARAPRRDPTDDGGVLVTIPLTAGLRWTF